jgi:hypothetical protein
MLELMVPIFTNGLEMLNKLAKYIYIFVPVYTQTTNPSHNKDRSKTTGECEMF